MAHYGGIVAMGSPVDSGNHDRNMRTGPSPGLLNRADNDISPGLSDIWKIWRSAAAFTSSLFCRFQASKRCSRSGFPLRVESPISVGSKRVYHSKRETLYS